MDGVGDPIDVVEVGDDLHRVVQGYFGETGFAQRFEIGLGHGGWRARQLLRIGAKSLVGGVEARRSPVGEQRSG